MRNRLLRVGIDRVTGFVTSFEALEKVVPQLVSPENLDRGAGAAFILDVRTGGEYEAGNIPGSEHIHGGRVLWNLDALPKDRPVFTYCGSGARSSVVASFLRAEGYNVAELDGTYGSWLAHRGPKVGVLTGLVGVGGGFLVIPALVLVCGVDMERAVGTSLLFVSQPPGASLGLHVCGERGGGVRLYRAFLYPDLLDPTRLHVEDDLVVAGDLLDVVHRQVEVSFKKSLDVHSEVRVPDLAQVADLLPVGSEHHRSGGLKLGKGL